MFKVLFRILAFVIGVLTVLDGGLPTSRHDMQVDSHNSYVSGTASRDTEYALNFVGGNAVSCTVGFVAYSKLNDGDAVTVKSSRIFNTCLEIQRGDEEIYHHRFWKLACLVGGALLIATAFGYSVPIENDEDWD